MRTRDHNVMDSLKNSGQRRLLFGVPSATIIIGHVKLFLAAGDRPVASTRAPKAPAPAASSLGEQVLSHAQSGREVIQEFVPLAESLEWELGQQYLRERG